MGRFLHPLRGIGVALLFGCVAAPAHAEERRPVTARLFLRRDPRAAGCIDGPALTRAVNRRWGRDVFVDGGDADIVLRARLSHLPGRGYGATIELSRRDGGSLGTREIATRSSECSALDDSLALAVGLMLDVSRRRIEEERRVADGPAATSPPGDVAKAPPESSAPPARSKSEPVVSGSRILVPEETFAPRAGTRFEPWVGAEAIVGAFPQIGLGMRAGIAIEPPHFVRVEAGGSWFFPRDATIGGGRGGSLSAWSAEISVCPFSYRGMLFRVHGCVSERFGQVRARGFGFAENAGVTEPLSQLGAGAVSTLHLGKDVGVRLGLRAELPVVRYRFVFTDSQGETEVVHGMAAVTGTAEVGLLVTW